MPVHGPLKLDDYRLLGRSGLRVSPLCLGTMTFGTEWGWGADRETSKQVFDTYARHGGNFIDTANFYTQGTSETFLADFLGAERERFVVATKYTLGMRRGDPNSGGNHRKSMVQSLEASLKRLKTDYIDLYWVHCWDYTTPVEEVMRALDDLVRAGKILYLGVSDVPAWLIARSQTMAELRGWTRFVALQVEYSLIERTVERELTPMAEALGIGVLPWSPLGGGVLTGKYSRADLAAQQQAGFDPKQLKGDNRPMGLTEKKIAAAEAVQVIAQETGRSPAQIALNWLLAKPNVVSPILGARKVGQLEDNLGSLAFALSPEHLQGLDEATAIERGFPHDFIEGPRVRDIVTAGTRVPRTPHV